MVQGRALLLQERESLRDRERLHLLEAFPLQVVVAAQRGILNRGLVVPVVEVQRLRVVTAIRLQLRQHKDSTEAKVDRKVIPTSRPVAAEARGEPGRVL